MAATYVRITRPGYTHSGRQFPVGAILRVPAPTAKAILDYEDPAWGEKIAADDAKGEHVFDLVGAEPANADPAPAQLDAPKK